MYYVLVKWNEVDVLHRANWLALAAVVSIFIAIVFLLASWSNVPTSFGVYWLDLNFYRLRLLLACLLLPVLIGSIGIAILMVGESLRLRWWILPLLWLANILACVACLPGVLVSHTHIDSNKLQNSVYNAMLVELPTGIDDPGWGDVVIYQCDGLGLLCRIIYRYRAWEADYFLKSHEWEARLATDPATNTITLQINDETVYTHRVE